MIKIEDKATWPAVGSTWQHRNGNTYRVLDFTNTQPERQDKYPTTIVYQNIYTLEKYSRRLVDWDRSMVKVC